MSGAVKACDGWKVHMLRGSIHDAGRCERGMVGGVWRLIGSEGCG